MCRKVIDAFLDDTAFFRCAVVEQYGFDYSRFGRSDEPLAIKRARAYKKFAEMLLHPYLQDVEDGVFLADSMTRCRGDDFLEKIMERFNLENGKRTFRHLEEVSSTLRQYQCLQICDLLLGCVLNNLCPPENIYKCAIRKYLCNRLEVSSFLRSAWKHVALDEVKESCPKFNAWFCNTKRKPRQSARPSDRRA